MYQKVNPRVGVPEGETGNPPPQKVTQGEISELESSKGKLGSQCVWTRGIDEIIYLPVAHGEGKFIVKDNTVLEQMKVNGQIVFQYSDKQGNAPGYPDDPNGSVEHIAGICDPTGRIFGLMPHPERFVFKTQHPHWTRKKNDFIPDGFKIFESAVNFLKKA
ncbi:MAG: phosphoribosylformylglycinamidine synthase subunit PurQ [Candidatus Omnitrophica bacterium]|nr:phosphoribosylformylglycinamidine synthase subunit PurQ [Candidatus Omnitrophota bacterium]